MSGTAASLRRKIASAGDLQSVVRTMKALAAANVGQYERAGAALADYQRCVELGLGVCLRNMLPGPPPEGGAPRRTEPGIDAIIFGSDQGLVGRFNDVVVDFALAKLAALPGRHRIWAVGQRALSRLADAGITPVGSFAVPNSVAAITPLVGRILVEREAHPVPGTPELHLFHNTPAPGAGYTPMAQRVLPLDAQWQGRLLKQHWPSPALPEVIGEPTAVLEELVREYLFVSVFRACAESLASENASRLAAMQRADRNIQDLLADAQAAFHQLRQSSIDEELFDVTAGFEALAR